MMCISIEYFYHMCASLTVKELCSYRRNHVRRIKRIV